MQTATNIDLDRLEANERKWVDDFARERGWENHHIDEPKDALELLLGEMQAGQSLLDVGCGWGNYVYRFSEAGLVYNGVDLSEEMLKAAREANPGLEFRQGTFRRLPFPDNHFDGVWSSCVLDGIPKRELAGVLAEHVRVLKPGGVMVIVMPSLGFSSEEPVEDDDGEVRRIQSVYGSDEFVGHLSKLPVTLIEGEDHCYSCGAMWFLFRK